MDFSDPKLDIVSAAEQGAWMIVIGPDGVPMDSRIRLLGADSQAFKEAVAETVADKAVELGNIAGNPSKEHTLKMAEFNRRATANHLAAVSAEWENIDWKGKPMECTPENAAKLYHRLPWLSEQASAFVANRSNYLGKE